MCKPIHTIKKKVYDYMFNLSMQALSKRAVLILVGIGLYSIPLALHADSGMLNAAEKIDKMTSIGVLTSVIMMLMGSLVYTIKIMLNKVEAQGERMQTCIDANTEVIGGVKEALNDFKRGWVNPPLR